MNLPSHLQFDFNNRPEIIHAKDTWKKNKNIHRLDNPILQDIKQQCLKSGSSWTMAHMQAFHIVHILDLEIKDVLPYEYIPDDNDELFNKFYLFWIIDRDDLYDKNWEKVFNINTNIDSKIKADIISCLNNLMTLIERRKSTDSDISTTTDEGEKIEFQTQVLASSICRTFLNILELHKKDKPSWDYVDSSAHFSHRKITILDYLYGNARNDGSIINVDKNNHVSSHIWIEVKPLEYAPRPKSENAYVNKIPQKAAEALSFVQSHWNTERLNVKDQETFGVEFNHRYVSFWHALFPKEYLLDVHRFSILDYNHAIALKRTKVFDLVESKDRKEFTKCFISILKYISQGKALIGKY